MVALKALERPAVACTAHAQTKIGGKSCRLLVRVGHAGLMRPKSPNPKPLGFRV